jgi:hypothetical protein
MIMPDWQYRIEAYRMLPRDLNSDGRRPAKHLRSSDLLAGGHIR